MAAIPERAPDQGALIEADPDVSLTALSDSYVMVTNNENSSTMAQTPASGMMCTSVR